MMQSYKTDRGRSFEQNDFGLLDNNIYDITVIWSSAVDVIPVRDALMIELSIADGRGLGWRRHEGESYGFQESVCRDDGITSHRSANQERKKLVLYSYIAVYRYLQSAVAQPLCWLAGCWN